MIVRIVSGEPTDGGRMERATRLAKLALGRYGLCDARLRLLRHGFQEVFLAEPRSRGRSACEPARTAAALRAVRRAASPPEPRFQGSLSGRIPLPGAIRIEDGRDAPGGWGGGA